MAGDSSGEARTISLWPLDDQDVDDLLAVFKEIASDRLVIGQKLAGEYRLGEPATIVAVITASSAAVGALTAFLLKRRQRSSVEYHLSIEYADGTSMQESIKVRASDSSPPDAELVRQLAALTRVTPRDVGDLAE